MSGDTGPLSARNPNVVQLRRLAGRRRARSEQGAFVVEGPVLVREALEAGVELEAVYIDVHAAGQPGVRQLVRDLETAGVALRWLAEGVLAKVADTSTPQALLAVAHGRPQSLGHFLADGPHGLVLVLAAVADPGNAGTLVRTAEAVGATAVVFSEGSVDPLGPKTVRAGAGSGFRVPLVQAGPAAEAIVALRSAGWRCVGTRADASTPYTQADLSGDVALVLGSEAHGIDETTSALLDEVVAIPMRGLVESLNVGVAGSLLAFEWSRR